LISSVKESGDESLPSPESPFQSTPSQDGPLSLPPIAKQAFPLALKIRRFLKVGSTKSKNAVFVRMIV
jgi:hypothetical protein